MAVATAGAATEAATTIGADRSLCRTRVAAERRRLVGTVAIPITGHRRWTTAERAIAGETAAMAATGEVRRATSAAESAHHAGMATIAAAETTESVAVPAVASVVNGTRSSLLAAARALPSRGGGRATNKSGGARLWVMTRKVEAAARCSAAPSRAAGRTTRRAGRARPDQVLGLARSC